MHSVTRGQFLRGDWQEHPLPPSPDTFAQINASCLTSQGVFCRTCSEACEPDAITFTPAVGCAPIPQINEDACTGCGECVGICPANALVLKQRHKKENL
jgi:ferredoxin